MLALDRRPDVPFKSSLQHLPVALRGEGARALSAFGAPLGRASWPWLRRPPPRALPLSLLPWDTASTARLSLADLIPQQMNQVGINSISGLGVAPIMVSSDGLQVWMHCSHGKLKHGC